MDYNIIISGLGGDGVIFLSKVITSAALNQGVEVKCYQNHGHAKRGGSVVAHIRIGKNSFSPMIPFATADLLFSFEINEGARYLHFLKDEAMVVVHHDRGADSAQIAHLKSSINNLSIIDLTDIIKSIDDPNTRNSAMLGFIITLDRFPLKSSICKDALLMVLPKEKRGINDAAFELGRRAKRQKI